MSAQQAVDEVRAGSLQRLALTFVAIVIPAGTCALAVAIGPGHRDPTAVLIAIGFLALVSAIQPDGHLPLVTIVAVVWYWLAVVPDHASPWSMACAALLYLFHTLTALLAMAPHSATIDRTTLWRSTARTGVIALTIVATWAIVELFTGRHAPGNAALTGLAVVIIIAAAVAVRALSLGAPPSPDPERIDG